ncbi:hypothetical protein BDR04DRAFT_1106327 [Suillus decipiens]|nr:hypothetical protein BDR04DRAFT_1106327 [Suillus decipiens]
MPPTVKPSIRRLQDLPDTSVSFQIPADSSSAEFLLADNSSDLDFLRGAGGASFATIAPTPARGKLKFSDVTPKATSRLLSPSRSPSPSLSAHQKNDHRPLPSKRQSPVKAKQMSLHPSKLKEIVLDGPAISEERLESLRAEVGTLNDDYDIPLHVQPLAVAQSSVINVTAAPDSKLKPRTRINSAVECGRKTKLVTQSRIPMSTADKLGLTSIVKPTVQLSSTCTSESGDVAIETEVQVSPACASGDSLNMVSNTSQSMTGRVAERLVSYSQKLMSSISIYNPRTENSFTAGTGTSVARTEEDIETQPPSVVDIVDAPCSPDNSSRNDYLLRLSEISPQKYHTQASSPGHLCTARRELSPMRPARKRPATEEDSASQQPSGSKKFKAKPLPQNAVAKSGLTISAGSSSQVLQPSTQKNRTPANTVLISRNSRYPTSNFPSARTKYKPRQNFQRQLPSTLIASSYLGSRTICKEEDKNVQGHEGVSTSLSVASQSRTSGSSRVHFDAGHVVSKKSAVVTRLERSRPSRPGLMPPLEKTSITLPPANITKPIAFTFHVDARVEARKAEFEKHGSVSEERGHRQRHGVPDFKVLHEAHQASLAWRKEHIMPIVPAPPIVFNTEIRAREREKFDEMVRIKEEDIQRAKEERRRQRDAEEEREIKELRKRAIPKANEVPEWYADMPKKGGSVGGSR